MDTDVIFKNWVSNLTEEDRIILGSSLEDDPIAIRQAFDKGFLAGLETALKAISGKKAGRS